MNGVLVIENGTIIVYCIKHRDKYLVHPVGNLFRQKTDYAHAARGYHPLIHFNDRQFVYPSTF